MPHSWAKRFRDDINLLMDFDEGDDFVCQLNGDWRIVFMYVEDFCALCLNVIRADIGAGPGRPQELAENSARFLRKKRTTHTSADAGRQ